MSLCFKCSIGKHTQHSEHLGRGLPTGIHLCDCEYCPNLCHCYICREIREDKRTSTGEYKKRK